MSAQRPTIVVTQPLHGDVLAELREIGDVSSNETGEPWSRAQLLSRCSGAEALIVFMPDAIDAEFLSACPRLEIISAALKGYDNFDVAACNARGVCFTIVPELLGEPTADLALTLLLAITRHVGLGDRHVRSGEFRGWRPRLYGRALDAGTAGIWGFGSVGQALARRLSAFGTTLLYHDVRRFSVQREVALGVRYCSWDELLQESDFLFPLVPLTVETQRIFDSGTLRRMRRGSYLVNCARGSLVDERAVAEALRDGQLAGYAADVFEMEDWVRSDRPREVPAELLAPELNTMFTPHLGSAVDSARRSIEREAVRRIAEWARGETPRYSVIAPGLGRA